MYQTHRQILWGFTSSLISSDLLVQYTWTGRSNQTKKYSFEELKQVQGVLWCAMVKISPEYSVQTFFEDIKTILAKSLRVKANNKENECENIEGKSNDGNENSDVD